MPVTAEATYAMAVSVFALPAHQYTRQRSMTLLVIRGCAGGVCGPLANRVWTVDCMGAGQKCKPVARHGP